MGGVKESSEGPARAYGGETAAERAARRREELIAAAFSIVAEHGRQGLRVEALCREASLNKRYFYESFSDLDAVVAALVHWLAEDAIGVALAELGTDRPDVQAARRAAAAFVMHLTDDPRRARVLFGAVPAGDAAAEHRASALRQLASIVAAHGRGIYDLGDDPRVDLAAAMMVGGTSQAVLDWLDGRIGGSREAFVDELVALWLVMADATTARVQADRDG
jgi:AcrR family transcriptional regulator